MHDVDALVAPEGRATRQQLTGWISPVTLRSWVATGRLVRLDQGLYATPRAATDWRLALRAVLRHRRGLASHATALAVWGLLPRWTGRSTSPSPRGAAAGGPTGWSCTAGTGRQHRPVEVAGRRVFLDAAYDEVMLAVEMDGAAYHGSRRQREGDIRRDALLATLGRQTLRFSYARLTTAPEDCRRQVLAVHAAGTASTSRNTHVFVCTGAHG